MMAEPNSFLDKYQQLLVQMPQEWQSIIKLHYINEDQLICVINGIPNQEFQQKIQGQSSVSISIILAGNGEVRFEQGACLTLTPNSVIFMRNNNQAQGYDYFAANQNICILDFRFSPTIFEKFVGESFNFKGKLLSDCSNHYDGEYMGKLPATLELIKIANQVLQCKIKNEEIKRLYLQAKSLEVLAISIEQFHLEKYNHSLPIALERQKLLTAQQIIEERKGKRCDIKTLCKMSGLNEKKLQSGFRLLFDQTVSQYRNQVRIKHACRLLENGDKIIHISTELGFDSPSHFAKIFKQIIGISPKKWQLKAEYSELTRTI